VKGVSSIYFAYPVQDGLGDATAAMAYAAREEGISRLVDLVMFQSSTDAPTPRMRQNFLSEQVFAWAGVGPLHIRATVFYENVARLVHSSLPARYEEITDDEWKTDALARGWNAHAVQHLSALWKSLRGAALAPEAGRFAVTDTIEKIGGAKPKTFEAFVREHRQDFAAPASF
jgi:hypothetical protein